LKNTQRFVNYVPITFSKRLIPDNILSLSILFCFNVSWYKQRDVEGIGDEWADKQEPGVSEHGPSKIYKENLYY